MSLNSGTPCRLPIRVNNLRFRAHFQYSELSSIPFIIIPRKCFCQPDRSVPLSPTPSTSFVVWCRCSLYPQSGHDLLCQQIHTPTRSSYSGRMSCFCLSRINSIPQVSWQSSQQRRPMLSRDSEWMGRRWRRRRQGNGQTSPLTPTHTR